MGLSLLCHHQCIVKWFIWPIRIIRLDCVIAIWSFGSLLESQSTNSAYATVTSCFTYFTTDPNIHLTKYETVYSTRRRPMTFVLRTFPSNSPSIPHHVKFPGLCTVIPSRCISRFWNVVFSQHIVWRWLDVNHSRQKTTHVYVHSFLLMLLFTAACPTDRNTRYVCSLQLSIDYSFFY
jgi:hypothetical protein